MADPKATSRDKTSRDKMLRRQPADSLIVDTDEGGDTSRIGRSIKT